MSDLSKRLGKRIYLFRKQNKLTQSALAERARISNEFMSSVERGAKLPSLPTLQRIAGVLGVGIKDLFDFDRGAFRAVQPFSREALDLAALLDRVPPRQRGRIVRIVKLLVTAGDI